MSMFCKCAVIILKKQTSNAIKSKKSAPLKEKPYKNSIKK